MSIFKRPATSRPEAAAAFFLSTMLVAAALFALSASARVIPAYLAGHSQPRTLLLRLVSPGPIVFGIVLAAGGVFAALSEWRMRGCTRLFWLERPWLHLTLLACGCVWFGHALMAPGLLVTGDAGSHVARVTHLIGALRHGDSLFWDNAYFAGGPLLQFTGPVFHWAATTIGLICGDATLAIKILVVCCRFGAGFFMYAFLRRWRFKSGAALAGALFYAGAFAATYLVSVRSSFPQAADLCLLPAVFLCLEGVIQGGRTGGIHWLGLCGATMLLVGAHQPTSILAGLYAAKYAGARLRHAPRRMAALRRLALAGAVIAIGSIYFLVPFLAEKSWTAENFSAHILSLHWPDLPTLLSWGGEGKGADYAAYLGLSVLACFLSGAFVLRRAAVSNQWRQLWLLCVVLVPLSACLTGSYVRDIIFTIFFLSAGAAASVQGWMEVARTENAVPLIAIAAFLVDVGPLTLQPWVRPDMQGIARAGETLAALAPAQRFLEVDISRSGIDVPVGPGASPLLYAHVQALYGPHKMDATPAHNGIVAISQLAQQDLAAHGRLGDTARGLLSLCNVGWVVGIEGSHMGLPPSWAGLSDVQGLGDVLRIDTATPFVTSGVLRGENRPAALGGMPLWAPDFADSRGQAAMQDAARLWRDMRVDLATDQAGAILMPDGGAAAANKAPVAHLVAYTVRPGDVEMSLMSDGAGFVRIAHPYFRSLQVSVNGAPVQARADVFGMIVLPLQAGRNDIEVTAHASLLRQSCFWISAAVFGILGMCAIFSVARRSVGMIRKKGLLF